jgi:hypothetical protein
MVVLLLPIITLLLYRIGGFYKSLRRMLFVPVEAVLDLSPRGESRVPTLVPVEQINLATVMALGQACEISRNVTAVHVVVDSEGESDLIERWDRQFPHIPLVVIDSPFRTVSDPLAAYIDDRLRQGPHEVNVVVPVVEVRHRHQRPLVNQSLGRLQSLLKRRRQVHIFPCMFDATTAGQRLRNDSKLQP